MRLFRWLLGFLLGYAFVVLVTEFGFRLLPEGRGSLAEGPLQTTYATLVAVVAGAGGGALGAWIGRSRGAGALIALPLILETCWLFFFKTPSVPRTIFEMAGAAALITCTVAGAFGFGFLEKRYRSASA